MLLLSVLMTFEGEQYGIYQPVQILRLDNNVFR